MSVRKSVPRTPREVRSGGLTGPFPRSSRLLDSKDYLRVMRGGRRRASRDLVVISVPNQTKSNKNKDLGDNLPGQSRLGITASRKVGNAVIRNRFKRRIRSWFRHRRADFSEQIDLVVIARKSGSQLSLDELDERLSKLLGLAPAPERAF